MRTSTNLHLYRCSGLSGPLRSRCATLVLITCSIAVIAVLTPNRADAQSCAGVTMESKSVSASTNKCGFPEHCSSTLHRYT